MHLNRVHEFALALSGEAAMEIEDRRYRFSEGRMAIIPSGIVHCEGRIGRQPYTLLWIGLAGKGALLNCSAYTPGKGWDCLLRYGLTCSATRRLAGVFPHLEDDRDGHMGAVAAGPGRRALGDPVATGSATRRGAAQPARRAAGADTRFH